LPTASVPDVIVGFLATISLISIGGITVPFPKLIGNEVIVIAMCLAYFVRNEDKAEVAATRDQDRAERAATRDQNKAEMVEMRVIAFLNFLVTIAASFAAYKFAIIEISK
jgi:hypothetical protein